MLLNRAAEEAAKSAAPVFVDAIRQMTITDVLGILKGGNNAATSYFKAKTTSTLTDAFKPTITVALSKVSVTWYWTDMFTMYNKFSKTPVNTDLSAYVKKCSVAARLSINNNSRMAISLPAALWLPDSFYKKSR